jgi:hypothetical protein
MAGKFKPVVLGLKSHRIHGLLPFFRASRTGDHLTKNNAATRGGARFQVDDGCKKPTATSLYTVDPLDPNHDATMRIEGEAPKQQQPILFPGAETMGGRRATATSDRFLAVSSLCAPRCQNFFFLPVADYAAECSLKPSGMTPSFA